MKKDSFLNELSERISQENELRARQPADHEHTSLQKHQQVHQVHWLQNLLKKCFLHFGMFLKKLSDSSTKQQFLTGFVYGKACAESQQDVASPEELQMKTS